MIGKKREYISQIERGNSDMQLSTFLQIANALGLKFAMVVGWFFLFIRFGQWILKLGSIDL